MYKFGLVIVVFLLIQELTAQVLPDSIAQKFKAFPEDRTLVDKLNEEASNSLGVNTDLSRTICSYSMNVAGRIKYTKGYARAFTVMGNSYWYEGVYEFAQNYYLLAVRQYKSISDSVGLGQTYNNIGEVYKKLSEPHKALEYLIKSIEYLKRDSLAQALVLYNIGELYVKVGNIEKAKEYIDASFEMAARHKDEKVIAYNYWTLAEIKIGEKDYNVAIDYLKRAEIIWSQLGEVRSLVQTYQNIADVYRHLEKYNVAEQHLLKAIELADKIKVADLQVKNYLEFAHLDSARGNYENAFQHLSRHNKLKDSVYNLLKAEQVARLQTIYETETREEENRQLRTEREFKDAQLKSQRLSLVAISVCLGAVVVLALTLYRQRKKILLQKNAIEMQATALIKLNEELQEFNKNLEERIRERTSQLTLQNQRLAEYTFINAHKLRAPVASILGLINLLSHADPSEKEDILKHLYTCSVQLDNVIREVSKNLEAAIIVTEVDSHGKEH
ncbi:tetratricopeptide repeat protein [Chryseosolibacter indicus]|uniref:Tetratricopeptide repeat protein n=1 Tax=Chryseosolibacter indicus TaxID=2782351 RepID=A0ABS5VPE9_9BACT|nr:tetratricopeptide repeat protein [Chryseosolibacter indicus]MBT1702734.1 tetratricopeptide repeat protein [Chryseosolibacter indicus]